MKNKIIRILAAVAMLFGLFPVLPASADVTVDVPIALSFENATGIDLNLRLNPLLVETAELVRPDAVLGNASYAAHQTGDKVKVAIASSVPLSCDGTLFYLRLTLRQAVGADDEPVKLLQIKLNETITWQAADCILLTGVRDGGLYDRAVVIGLNEGTAVLDGQPYASQTPIEAEGTHTLQATDNNGKTRTVQFAIDTTPPVITVAPYDTKPSKGPLVVYASANEGTLNVDQHTFTENGSFTFVATDAAGNRTEKTVTVSHLYETFTMSLQNAPQLPAVSEGGQLDISGWELYIQYDNGMHERVAVTQEMLDYSTDTPGGSEAILRWNGAELRVGIQVEAATLIGITLTQKPSKLTYTVGEELDLTGVQLTAVYDNGSERPCELASVVISGFDSSKVGVQTVTIAVGDVFTTFEVTVVESEPEPTKRLGDVNGDGKVDSGDALQLLRYSAEIITSDDIDMSVADLNGDHTVDTGDVLLLLRYAAEIIDTFPAGI